MEIQNIQNESWNNNKKSCVEKSSRKRSRSNQLATMEEAFGKLKKKPLGARGVSKLPKSVGHEWKTASILWMRVVFIQSFCPRVGPKKL